MCKITRCLESEYARGYCKAHYTNYLRTGNATRKYNRTNPVAVQKLQEAAVNGELQHILDQDYSLAAVAEHYGVSIPCLGKHIKNYDLRRIANYRRGKTCIALADKISPAKRIALYGSWNITPYAQRYYFYP